MNRKTEIVEIILSDEIDISKLPEISPETQSRITKLVLLARQEKAILDAKKIHDDSVKKCYDLLYSRMQQTKSTKEELNTIGKTKNISLLVYKIRQLIKTRGDLWELKKGKSNNQTVYYLIPKEQASTTD